MLVVPDVWVIALCFGSCLVWLGCYVSCVYSLQLYHVLRFFNLLGVLLALEILWLDVLVILHCPFTLAFICFLQGQYLMLLVFSGVA